MDIDTTTFTTTIRTTFSIPAKFMLICYHIFRFWSNHSRRFVDFCMIFIEERLYEGVPTALVPSGFLKRRGGFYSVKSDTNANSRTWWIDHVPKGTEKIQVFLEADTFFLKNYSEIRIESVVCRSKSSKEDSAFSENGSFSSEYS